MIKNFVAFISVVIIFLSLFNITYSLTGFAINDGAAVNVSIQEAVVINFTVNYLDFGSGSVILGNDNATIDTLGNVVGGNWTPSIGGFVLENLGNTNVSLFLKSEKDALDFLGGTSPGYYYSLVNNEAGSCTNSSLVFGDWYEVNTSLSGTNICKLFLFNQSSNELEINVKLVIPSDATVGQLSDSFTAIGSVI